VLVRVRAASVNPADWHFMRGLPYVARLVFGVRRPRRATVAGSDMAGQVEAAGANVKRFRPGDEVFGLTRGPDHTGAGTGGCAEYAGVPAGFLQLKPAGLTFEQAAAVPLAALTALQALRDTGQLQPGQKVRASGRPLPGRALARRRGLPEWRPTSCASAVVGQVWRNGRKQANLTRILAGLASSHSVRTTASASVNYPRCQAPQISSVVRGPS